MIEDATALVGTEPEAFFLLAILYSAERCYTGCWARKAIKVRSQLWTLYGTLLARCAHWYKRGIASTEVTKHFISLTRFEGMSCLRGNWCLVLSIWQKKSQWLERSTNTVILLNRRIKVHSKYLCPQVGAAWIFAQTTFRQKSSGKVTAEIYNWGDMPSPKWACTSLLPGRAGGRAERGVWTVVFWQGMPTGFWTHTSWDCLHKTKQDLTHQHSILDGREARGATPLPEEPLAVSGCQGNGDSFFGGIATWMLSTLLW